MTSIAFLGLDGIGAPMAGRLLDAGHELTVWDPVPARAAGLADRGARSVGTAAEAVAGREVVLGFFGGAAAMLDALFDGGSREPKVEFEPGALYAVLFALGPKGITELRDRLPSSVRLVDAPAQGDLTQAEQGQLKVYLAGDAQDVAEAATLLAPLGSTWPLGGLGAASSIALVVNSTLLASMSKYKEAHNRTKKSGVRQGTAAEAASSTATTTATADGAAATGEAAGSASARGGADELLAERVTEAVKEREAHGITKESFMQAVASGQPVVDVAAAVRQALTKNMLRPIPDADQHDQHDEREQQPVNDEP